MTLNTAAAILQRNRTLDVLAATCEQYIQSEEDRTRCKIGANYLHQNKNRRANGRADAL